MAILCSASFLYSHVYRFQWFWNYCVPITPEYTVIEKTGHEFETSKLFAELNKYGVKQFTRSGRIAVTRSNVELLDEFLNQREGEENGK